jgi:hypothetical protein
MDDERVTHAVHVPYVRNQNELRPRNIKQLVAIAKDFSVFSRYASPSPNNPRGVLRTGLSREFNIYVFH